MIVKVCGMKYPENIEQVEQTGIDWMGFIFTSISARNFDILPQYLPQKLKRVGVFVNPSHNDIEQKITDFSLDMVQLHGDESPEFCLYWKNKGVPVIKAISATDSIATTTLKYQNKVDYFLFDTPCKGYGGSGKQFDWSILNHYQGSTPFLLSGGISPDHLQSIKDFYHPSCVGIDINSGFEHTPAVKNVEAIQSFVKHLKSKS